MFTVRRRLRDNALFALHHRQSTIDHPRHLLGGPCSCAFPFALGSGTEHVTTPNNALLATTRSAASNSDANDEADIAGWQPSNGLWFIIPSSNPSNYVVQKGASRS